MLHNRQLCKQYLTGTKPTNSTNFSAGFGHDSGRGKIPYSRVFSLVKYFVSQILAGSNFRHRTF